MLSSSSLVKFLLVIRTSTSTVPLVSGNVQDQAMKDMGQRDISRQMGPPKSPPKPREFGGCCEGTRRNILHPLEETISGPSAPLGDPSVDWAILHLPKFLPDPPK